jgi:hypothetical protein
MLANPSLEPEPYDLEATAYHEAGHAAMAVMWGIPIDWVAIQPLPERFGGRIGGVTFSQDDLGMVMCSREADADELKRTWFARMQMVCAGPQAEARFSGRPVYFLWSDISQIEQLKNSCGQDQPNQIAVECDHLARLKVAERWRQIEAVALALIDRKYLSGDEVAEITGRTDLARA